MENNYITLVQYPSDMSTEDAMTLYLQEEFKFSKNHNIDEISKISFRILRDNHIADRDKFNSKKLFSNKSNYSSMDAMYTVGNYDSAMSYLNHLSNYKEWDPHLSNMTFIMDFATIWKADRKSLMEFLVDIIPHKETLNIIIFANKNYNDDEDLSKLVDISIDISKSKNIYIYSNTIAISNEIYEKNFNKLDNGYFKYIDQFTDLIKFVSSNTKGNILNQCINSYTIDSICFIRFTSCKMTDKEEKIYSELSQYYNIRTYDSYCFASLYNTNIHKNHLIEDTLIDKSIKYIIIYFSNVMHNLVFKNVFNKDSIIHKYFDEMIFDDYYLYKRKNEV